MNTKRGWALAIAAIVIIAALGAGTAIWYANKQGALPSPQGQGGAVTHPTSTPAADFSGWKTYTDAQNGYTVKYPSPWTQTSVAVGSGTNTFTSITIYNPAAPYNSGIQVQKAEAIEGTSTLDAAVESYMSSYTDSSHGYGWTYTAPASSTISNLPAVMTDLTTKLNGKPLGVTRCIFFAVNNNLFEIIYPLQQIPQDLSQVQMMLSTFTVDQNH